MRFVPQLGTGCRWWSCSSQNSNKTPDEFVQPPSIISVYEVGYGWLKELVYKKIAGKWFKIEYEMGYLKYCTKYKVEDFANKETIHIWNVSYCSLCCFYNINYSTTVVKIPGTDEHECFGNYSEYHTYLLENLKMLNTSQHGQEKNV